MQLSQARTIAGSKAFTGIRPRRVAAVSNGVKYTMKRKDSYMVEVSRSSEQGSPCKDLHAWPRANVFSNPT
jgi:hypothetical protein